MRKVLIPTTDGKTIVVDSVWQLINKYKYIGFEEKGGDRYFIVVCGTAKGLAVNAEGTFSTKEKQMKIDKGYFVFDQIEDLYDWVLKNKRFAKI